MKNQRNLLEKVKKTYPHRADLIVQCLKNLSDILSQTIIEINRKTESNIQASNYENVSSDLKTIKDLERTRSMLNSIMSQSESSGIEQEGQSKFKQMKIIRSNEKMETEYYAIENILVNVNNAKIHSYRLCNEQLQRVHSWPDLLYHFSRRLIKQDVKKFKDVEQDHMINGRKKKFFLSKTDPMRRIKPLGKDLYIDMNHTEKEIKKAIYLLLAEFQMQINDLLIYYTR